MKHMSMRAYIALFLLTIYMDANAQVQWVETFGGAVDGHMGSGLTLAVAPDGAVYGTGAFTGTIDFNGPLTSSSGGSDVVIVKLNSSGESIWARGFGGSNFFNYSDYGRFIAVDAVNNRVVVGGEIHTLFNIDTIVFDGTTSSTGGNTFLASFDTDGNIEWGRAIQCSSGRVSLLDMHVSSSGLTFGIGYATCQTIAPGVTPQVVGPGGFVVKYLANGDLLSAETPITGGYLEAVEWISPNDWLMVGGFGGPQAAVYGQVLSMPPGQSNAGFISRSDTVGNVQWSQVLRSSESCGLYDCARDPNGSMYVLGYFHADIVLGADTLRPAPGRSSGYFLAALNEQGAFQWALPFSGMSSSDRMVALAPDGSIYVSGTLFNDTLWVGTTPYPPLSDMDHYVAHIGTQGQVLGLLRSPNSGSMYTNIVPTADALYLSFSFDSTMQFVDTTLTNPGGANMSCLVAKLGELNWTTSMRSMESTSGELHIYANPNNGLCTIDLPEELRLTDDLMLSVFDNTGQLVQRVPLRYSEQGVRLDIRTQARGIYHVELGDGQQRYTGTIVFE